MTKYKLPMITKQGAHASGQNVRGLQPRC